tara:strand:+ start:113 stop:1507 length:1395 start_codon:yes stop_codon:yes gene_type:complete
MTVTTTTSRAELNGNGTAGPFQCGFRVLADSDLQVYVGGVLKTLTTHYTVANAGTTTNATVTFTAGNFPASGTANVVLVRNVPYTQPTDYQNNTALDAETLEASFDRSTMQSQQLSTDRDRTIRFADTVTSVTTAETEISDVAADRANKLLAFNSSGQLSATQEIGVWQGAWATDTTYYVRDLIRQNDTGAVYICTTEHESDNFTTDVTAGKWSAVIDAGGFNVKLTANLTIGSGQTYITPYKIDLNGKILENNGTLICAEIITGDGTLTGSGSTTESGPVSVGGSSFVTPTGTQTLTNKSLTAPVLTGSASSAGSILFKEDTDNGTNAVTLKGPASTADVTLTLPSATDTLVARDTTDTLTQKTLTSPDINTPDIDGGSIDGTTIGSSSHTTGKFTTCDATTDFTIGGTVVTDGQIADDGNFTFDIDGDLTVDVNGGDVTYKDDGTTFLAISYSGGNTTITGP